MSNKNPKVKKLTPRQEDAMERSEDLTTKARIIELGVERWIHEEGYASGMVVCSKLLAEAVQYRRESNTIPPTFHC